MKEFRPPRGDDNERINEGIALVYRLMEENPQIEETLWATITTFVLLNGYKNCGFSYEEFRQEIHSAFEHYKDNF